MATGQPGKQPVVAPTPQVPLNPEQPQQQKEQNYVSVWDRFWTDDLGGTLDNVWTDDFSAVPVVGPLASAGAKGYTAASNSLNQVASAAFLAAEANYWRNRGANSNLWDDASNISAGQAFSNMMSESRYLATPQFNIADPAQRKAAYQNGGMGQLTTGLFDAIASWYLDPLVIGGKAAKVARFGSEAFDVAGKTTRLTNIEGVIDNIGFEADDAIKYLESAGELGVKNSIYEKAIAGAKMNYDELLNAEWVTGPYKDALAHIGAQIDDPITFAKFLAAGTGNQRYLAALDNEAAAVSDALKIAKQPTAYEDLWIEQFMPGADPRAVVPMLRNSVEEGSDAGKVLDDLVQRDAALRDALDLFEVSYAPIERIGTGKRGIGEAFRAGAATPKGEQAGTWIGRGASKLTPEDLAVAATETNLKAPQILDRLKNGIISTSKVDDVVYRDIAGLRIPISEGRRAAVQETVYQLGSGWRKVRVWSGADWISKERGSGWIAIRGLDDGVASEELAAALTDSKVLRKDGQFLATLINRWGSAAGSLDRTAALDDIENLAVAKIAEFYRVDPEIARGAYNLVQSKRNDMIQMLRERKGKAFGIDPEDGSLITLTPQMRSQLDTKVPMLDFRIMEQTIKRLSSPEYRSFADNIKIALSGGKREELSVVAVNFLDELNSLWKANVLFRLGYTQRNVAEGWLRSWAALGTVPALRPSAMVTGAGRLVANPYRAGRRRQLEGYRANLSGIMETTRVSIKQLDDEISSYLDDSGNLINEVTDAEALKSALNQKEELSKQLDDMARQFDESTKLKEKYKKRFIGDTEAFAGELGDLRRQLASNMETVENFFLTKAARDMDISLSRNSWTKVMPDQEQYWVSLERGVQQFRNDPLARMVMDGATPDEMFKWLKTEGKSYADEMKLVSNAYKRERVDTLYGMVNDYLPTQEARAMALADNAPDSLSLQAVLGGLEGLKPVHGLQKVNEALQPMKGIKDYYSQILEGGFKFLGSLPESALVRQPFYNEVWKTQREAMVSSAWKQFDGDIPAAALKKIEETAHRRALQATNDTLFTIARYSNPAAVLRFIAPFFAAWENSMRTWSRLVINDPSILGRANILWELPNNLGMVYNPNTGEKVESDEFGFLTGSQDQVVVMWKPLADLYEKVTGMPAVVPKGALNVVTPGESAFLPGGGPAVTYPVAQILADRPDLQQTIKDAVGETLYNQIVPFGQVEPDWKKNFLGAGFRKTWQAFEGEANQEYLAVVDAMTKDMLITARLNNEPDPSAEEVRAATDRWFKFSIGASFSAPFALQRQSKYQVQINEWNRIKALPNLSYEQKMSMFKEKWPEDAYAPITQSTSTSAARGIDYNLATFDVLKKYPKEIEMLANIPTPDGKTDASAIAVLMASIAGDPMNPASTAFNPGVYDYLGQTNVPGTQIPFREKKTAAEVINTAKVQDMWTEYNKEKALRDAALTKLGVKSVNTNAARDAGVADRWNSFEARMAEKYADTWVAAGPQAYQRNSGRYLGAINKLVTDEKFMSSELGQSNVWSQISNYMGQRKLAQDAYQATTGNARKLVKARWDAYKESVKDSSLIFSDYYDQFFDGDDLSTEVR